MDDIDEPRTIDGIKAKWLIEIAKRLEDIEGELSDIRAVLTGFTERGVPAIVEAIRLLRRD